MSQKRLLAGIWLGMRFRHLSSIKRLALGSRLPAICIEKVSGAMIAPVCRLMQLFVILNQDSELVYGVGHPKYRLLKSLMLETE